MRFVAVLLAYFNALTRVFQFDDYNVIVNNPAVHSLAAWRDSMPGIRPLLKFSYALHPVQTEAVTYVSGRSVSFPGGDLPVLRELFRGAYARDAAAHDHCHD